MSGWCRILVVFVLAATASASAQDGGLPDGGSSDGGVPVGDAAAPMLSVGPAAPQVEVFATTSEPGRAVATAQRAALVTAGDVAAEINRRVPALRAAYIDPARIEELTRAVVRDRVLAETARRAGLLDDAEVKREIERLLARVLLERALVADPGPPLGDVEVRAFYDAHLADYTKPEQVRVLAIVLASRPEALQVLAEVARVGERRFGAVARRRSTDAQSRRRDGNLGWLFVGSRPESALIEAAFALRVGHTIASPLEIAGNFYILRAVERRAPEAVTLERARSAVVSRMRAEQRQRVADVLLARATREQGVRVRSAASVVHVAP